MTNMKISVLICKLALIVALVVLIATSVWKMLGVPIQPEQLKPAITTGMQE